jgi:hypothetical protein
MTQRLAFLRYATALGCLTGNQIHETLPLR